jgi:hypothetical protein
MAQKPWRTVQVSEDTGRFTREQVQAAVEAVKAQKEAKNKSGDRSVDTDKPVKPKSLPRKS